MMADNDDDCEYVTDSEMFAESLSPKLSEIYYGTSAESKLLETYSDYHDSCSEKEWD